MIWTNKKPTKEYIESLPDQKGWYWHKNPKKNNGMPWVVCAYLSGDHLFITDFKNDTNRFYGDDQMWAGPIPMPVEQDFFESEKMEEWLKQMEMKLVTFNEYQNKAGETATYPQRGENLVYPTLGLCGESGEIAEKVKKVIRDKGGVLDDDTKDALAKELGDVLWYLSQTAHELGITLEEVANLNIKKLTSRKERGKIHGSGDDR